ncbi:ABC transporter ATP-binding protein [Clostridium sp. AL.422]|uniref:ABC transporter ATP-binding protein n=1 Tax=Clostridium TaxID=1485 RepID=UPI00293DD102|nr:MULTISPECIES: ABC transporter ATP-binding protein [unclassified Clostridium]MDV4150462.1 ABC transporter ATP-binding protein [Clostridium sp. AL.422]
MATKLELKSVCKRFGGVVAANNVSFKVNEGEILGLIGPNGAGKSTILNLISGIYDVDDGQIIFDGKDITKEKAHNIARIGLGRTFQTPRFLERSNIRENLMLGQDLRYQTGYLKSYFHAKEKSLNDELDELLKIAGLKINLDDDISSLSYGQMKILEIVRSMLANPKVMLVDEPAAGLNNKEIEYANALLNLAAKEKGIGVVLIEHQMDMVINICHNIVVLNFGEIIARGNPEEALSNPKVVEAYLGKELNLSN